MADRTEHLDGYRVALEESGGRISLVNRFISGGQPIHAKTLVEVDDDVEGRARLSRLLALHQAVNSFLTYGGTLNEVDEAILARFDPAFGAYRTWQMPHVFTRVDSTRTHVFRDDEKQQFVVITEDAFVETMTAEQVRKSIVEPPQRPFDPASLDDWTFADELELPDDPEDGDGQGLQSLRPPDDAG